MATALPHQVVLQDFFRWERQSLVEVAADLTTDEKAFFMPVETLKSYFRGNGGRKLNKILLEVFEPDEVPTDPEVILRGHTAVFCILLRIAKGRLIEEFAYFEELSDQRLPFDPAHPPAHFPEDDEDLTFLQRFCETQWMYCVPVFDDHMSHRYFGRERLLPIVHKEACSGERDKPVYKIKLYGSHNKLVPAGSEIQVNPTDPNTFMVKTYLKKEEYRQEVKNFTSSKHTDSIVRFYGCYTHGASYNILLEYADKGSLEEYFQKQTPPSRGGDIIKFWENLFQLIKALKAIHSFLGGHHNVNPSSVLVLSYGAESAFNWRFKLGDFGSGSSQGKTAPASGVVTSDSRGPQAYGAPECYASPDEGTEIRKRSSKNTQAADIWSLGCIYSEAAVWIADGYDGVVDYRRQRMAEIEGVPNHKGGDSFHDGERALKAVINAHREVEQRLRRSDYITKDILDTMVDEMLWEEDRPGAKALLRRADGIVSRARQKLSSTTATPKHPPSIGPDPSTRPNSSSSRSRPYVLPQSPPHPPPERPLPERPRVSTSRSSSSQRQSPPNVETWRTLVRVPSSDLASSAYGGGTRTSPGSELDTDAASSTSGWQGANRESLASPYTSPFPSPHTSSQFEYARAMPIERRRGPSPSQRSSSRQRPGKRPHRQSLKDTVESSDDGPVGPSSSQLYAEFMQESINTSSINTRGHGGPIIDIITDIKADNRSTSSAYTPSTTSSAPQGIMLPSSTYNPSTTSSAPQGNMPPPPPFLDEIPYPAPLHPTPPPKRSQGFSLFPSRNANAQFVPPLPPQPLPTPPPTVDIPTSKVPVYQDRPMTRSDSISNNSVSTITTSQYNSYSSASQLSLSGVLEWKRAHKKSKKNARVPPVRGADLLDKLNDRDHVFIINDGISMREQWPQVKTAFEALSYVLKPMAPDGIELFFTNAYDTWRRHNTTELVDLLEKKGLAGDTDIAYRLSLQLQDYQIKTRRPAAQAASKKVKRTRPMSFYVLTNGNWKQGADPTSAIREMAEHLLGANLRAGHVTIQFVTFGQDPVGQQRINDVVNTDFGLDIVDSTPSTGDVLKMLCGPLDKNYFLGGSNSSVSGTTGSASTLILPLTSLPPIELA